MMSKTIRAFTCAAVLFWAAPALAQSTITLPNGISAPYSGTTAPAFSSAPGLSGDTYYTAFDTATGARYIYSAAGNWVGYQNTLNPTAPAPAGAPVVPTTVTLPNGTNVPYSGVGLPEIGTRADGIHYVADPVAQRATYFNAQGQEIGGGSWGATPATGSSSFGGTQSGTTTSGTTGGTVPGGPSGGGNPTSVPEPALAALFALGSGIMMTLRRRKAR